MNAGLSYLVILCTVIIAILGFLLRDASPLSYLILALGVVSALTSVALLIRTRREMARIKNITNATAHSHFGGL